MKNVFIRGNSGCNGRDSSSMISIAAAINPAGTRGITHVIRKMRFTGSLILLRRRPNFAHFLDTAYKQKKQIYQYKTIHEGISIWYSFSSYLYIKDILYSLGWSETSILAIELWEILFLLLLKLPFRSHSRSLVYFFEAEEPTWEETPTRLHTLQLFSWSTIQKVLEFPISTIIYFL